VAIDAADPVSLAGFYRQFLGLEVYWQSEDFVSLRGAGVLLTFQRIPDYQRPEWPTGSRPKQLHLELAVDDLDEAEAVALQFGARKPDVQPSPDRWRVLLDPAGHPFCVTTLIPDLKA
jgi:catechol 2,3-dioxygenase-like lactoylglutathione lyase family enzyme